MADDKTERGKGTVEIVYKYDQWELGYGTVIREVVADFYDAMQLIKEEREFDDYMCIAMNLKWVGIGDREHPQIFLSQNQLLLPRNWHEGSKATRIQALMGLLLQFAH